MTRDQAVPARAHDVARGLVHLLMARSAVLVEEGYATADGVDLAMRLGCGLPVGPVDALRSAGTATVRHSLVTAPPTHVPVEDAVSELLDRWGSGEPLAGVPSEERRTPPGDTSPRPDPSTGLSGQAGVLGSGTMATGIAEVLARAGHDTVLVARTQAKAEAAVERVSRSTDRAVQRGKMAAEARARTLERLQARSDRTALDGCKLVVEALVEDLEVKKRAFVSLDSICKPETILATTTSSLSVGALAEVTSRPADVIGLHFFNPAPVMKLVEVIRTERTGDETWRSALALCSTLGKTGVPCPDRTGFIVNYLLLPYLNDAVRALDRAGVDVTGLDTAIETGFGYPLGPFRLLDTIGLDVALTIQRELHEAFGAPWLEPAPLLEEMVGQGRLGRKAGAGFHAYERRSG